jgi:Ni,Fe-hydrogenase III component G
MDEKTTLALQAAENLLAPYTTEFKRPEADRLDAYVTIEQFKPAMTALLKDHWGYVAAITGLDQPAPAAAEGTEPGEGHIEGLYHISQGAAIVTVRVSVPYSNPVIPTICDLNAAATLAEREFIELFGVVCEGTPNTDKLVLPDDWPDGVYPLRKSFTVFAKSGQEKAQ